MSKTRLVVVGNGMAGARLVEDLLARGGQDRFAGLLRDARAKVLATQLDNSAAWVVADLAAARAGVVHLPLPTFFTRQQRAHALAAAGADALLLNRQHFTADVAGVTTRRTQVVARSEIELIRLSNRAVMLPADTAKVTFTRIPTLDEVPYPVRMEPNLVVEFYSR